ncbi:MAG: response regulator [Candidatus Woesearchaeota archaeon]
MMHAVDKETDTKRILLVEDDLRFASSIVEHLGNIGYQVSQARTGGIGLDVLRTALDENQSFGLYIVDLQVHAGTLAAMTAYHHGASGAVHPESMHGIHFIHKASELNGHTPAIIISPYKGGRLVEDARKHGIVLFNPVSLDVLAAEVAKHYHG